MPKISEPTALPDGDGQVPETPSRRDVAREARDLAVAARAQPSRKRGARSPVYDLLWDNFEALRPELDAPVMFGSERWDAFAEGLAGRGYTDGSGKPPRGETVRKTWWKVSRDRTRWQQGEPSRSRGRPRQARAAVDVAPEPVVQPIPVRATPLPRVEPRPALPEPEDDLPPLDGPYTFKLATPKGWTPGGGKPG